VVVAAVRYLAEIGEPAVERWLRALARDADAETRLLVGAARRALEAELKRGARDVEERILVALTERDRAVRASLARRLRTVPVAEVLDQAAVLLADDPGGIVQIVAEIRAPDVTRLLLRIASDEAVDLAVRARAAGAIEADEAWERDALVELALQGAVDPGIRAAAAQTLGAFAPSQLVTERLGALAADPSPIVRGALLWAIQLAARPHELRGHDRIAAETVLRRALGDEDAAVRRRAAYVAGNLDAASLVGDLAELAKREREHADLRLAAFVALGDIASPARFADLVYLWNREDDPEALAAASRAIERSVEGGLSADAGDAGDHAPSAPPSLARVHDRLPKLLASGDARVRAAAARVAGLLSAEDKTAAATREPLARLTEDPSPRVRRAAIVALGRAARNSSPQGSSDERAATLAAALDDADGAVQERAAEALLSLTTAEGFVQVVQFVARASDRHAARRVVQALGGASRALDDEARIRLLGAALAKVGHDDPVYEPLLALKLAALESARPTFSSRVPVDQAIAELFPRWSRLREVRGFAPLARSLRTAETLFSSQGSGSDADLSAGIVLWMKSLEGYLHAWLAPKLRELQTRSSLLWELAGKLAGASWTSYQRWVDERWTDPVTVGSLTVEVPLRSAVHALRDLAERRGRTFDSPMSVTEWSRLMLFFAVDHPSGPKNVLELAWRDPDRAVRLLHRLQVLAQVRNTVTHRSVADASTLAEFRRVYYGAFEELTRLAG
jgi:hypothetical protein